jgi:hypothetical protein
MQYYQLRSAGKAAKDAGEYQRNLALQDAGQAQARSQQDAITRRRRGDILAGRRSASESASGGIDPTGYGAARLESTIDYNVLSALFEGDEAARGLRQEGETAYYLGKTKQTALKQRALTGLVESAGQAAGYAGQAGAFSPSGTTGTTGGNFSTGAGFESPSRMAVIYGEGGFNPSSPGQYYRGYSGGVR